MGIRLGTWLAALGILSAPAADLDRAVSSAMRGREGVVLAAQVSTGKPLAGYHGGHGPARLVAPGSTIKPFTLMKLLESGEARLPCRTLVRIAGRRYDCSHPSLALPLDGAMALAYSCNSYFTQAARRLDARSFAEHLRRWGLSNAGGLVDVASGEEQLQLQAIGESAVLVTPQGLLEAYRNLARRKDVPSAVIEGLMGATEYGSAQWAQPAALRAAGKTGTTPDARRSGTHAWFAGFAPAGDPQVVVVVFLEQGRGGSNAAPVAKAVFEAWARR